MNGPPRGLSNMLAPPDEDDGVAWPHRDGGKASELASGGLIRRCDARIDLRAQELPVAPSGCRVGQLRETTPPSRADPIFGER